MININDENLDYNISYLVCVPKSRLDYLEALDYTLSNVCVFEPTDTYVKKLIDFCVTNQIKKVILVDYMLEYENLATQLQDYNIEICDYLLVELGALTIQWHYEVFDGVLKLYKYGYIKNIITIDKNMESALKGNFKVHHLPLDFPTVQNNDMSIKKDGIGILSNAVEPTHGFYNALSAVKLINEVTNIDKEVIVRPIKEFKELFSVQMQYKQTEQILKNSEVNIYVNFTNNNYGWFFKSMDYGVPCIMGNQQIIEPSEKLYDYIIVKSDDDITEIADKIVYIKKHKQEIIELYDDFRKRYSENVKKIRNKILPECTQGFRNESDMLLSVVVPIYNVENFLSDAVNSIVRAQIPKMEILLINDGSTDKSGEIAKNLQKKYPDLIRYIEQTNHGLGNVRNVGLKEARGKYITSVDSDDLIDTKTFKEALLYLKQNVDMIIYDWQSVDVVTGNKYTTSAKDGIGDRKNNFEDFLYASIAPSACNKIIKKSLYDELGLEFSETKYEDLSLNPLLIMKAKSIAYIPKPYYVYNLRQGSIMRSSGGGINFDMIRSLKLLDERLVKFFSEYKNYDELYYYVFFWRIEELILNYIYENITVDGKDAFYEEFLPLFKKIYNTKKVKEFFGKMPEKTKRFYEERNKAVLNKQLKEFVEKTSKNIIKLNAGDIYAFKDDIG